ncbi:hypothetical protein NQ315_010885 [Exocentrus adspersus]|uniref:ZAD domain-containing protein n=1 Tax=Exocentrus adspersus TaxID=1586481 RepID=A0AAV8VPI9_9CUCU|nr:hypothetical protein NQ315_010885 [Exocentrus adspersus]
METKLCRICANFGQNFVHIFKTEGLRDKIETCLPIVVSPYCLLPDTICGECTETIDSFYGFMKKCLQSIIVLEAQYDIHESCLKSKRKKDKGCFVDFAHERSNMGVQTEDCMDVLIGRDADLKEYSSNFPLITKFLDTADMSKLKPVPSLVDYDIDSDSNVDDNDLDTGNVVLGDKLETLTKITNFVDSFLSQKSLFMSRRYNLDNADNDLISEITHRKSLKRKCDTIENSRTKIFKMDSWNRRKNKQPKKFEVQMSGFGDNFYSLDAFAPIYQNDKSLVNGFEKTDSPNSDTDNQPNALTRLTDQDDNLDYAEGGFKQDFHIKEEMEIAAPKEIDSSHNLYNNIITNYTPPLNEGDYNKFNARSNSNTVDSVLNEANLFKPKPDELDSAIKSISYECAQPEDVKVEDDYCEMHNNGINENEIESAVGSIL